MTYFPIGRWIEFKLDNRWRSGLVEGYNHATHGAGVVSYKVMDIAGARCDCTPDNVRRHDPSNPPTLRQAIEEMVLL